MISSFFALSESGELSTVARGFGSDTFTVVPLASLLHLRGI
jgi:hypothetical protein